MKPIVASNHRLSRIEIPLPVDENGEYVVDENGKLIKGRAPVVLSLPRRDCLSRKQFKELIRLLNEVDDLKGDDGEPMSVVEKQFEVELRTLRLFVTDEQFELLEGLTLGELTAITRELAKESEVTLPELLASTNSSKSSARRSSTTLFEQDSDSETSEKG